MTVNGCITRTLGDASRRPGGCAPFAYYCGYISVRAETV
jgi:hypothetical protein